MSKPPRDIPAPHEIQKFQEQLEKYKDKMEEFKTAPDVPTKKLMDIYPVLQKERGMLIKHCSTAKKMKKYDHANDLHIKIYEHFMENNLLIYLEGEFREVLIKSLKEKNRNAYVHSHNAIQLEGEFTFMFYNSYDEELEERELILTLDKKDKDVFDVVLKRNIEDGMENSSLVGRGEITEDNHLELNYSEKNNYKQHAVFKLPHRIEKNYELLVGSFLGKYQSIQYHHIGVLINKRNTEDKDDITILKKNNQFWDKAHRTHYFLDNAASKLYLDKIDDSFIELRHTFEVEKYLPINKSKRKLLSKIEGKYRLVYINKKNQIYSDAVLTLKLNDRNFLSAEYCNNRTTTNMYGWAGVSDDNILCIYLYLERGSTPQHLIIKLWDKIEPFEHLIGLLQGSYSSLIDSFVCVLVKEKADEKEEELEAKIKALENISSFWEVAKERINEIHAQVKDYRKLENITPEILGIPVKSNNQGKITSKLEGTYKIYSRSRNSKTNQNHDININSACIKREGKKLKSYVQGKSGIHEGFIEKRINFFQVRSIRNIDFEEQDVWGLFTFTINQLENIELFIGLYTGPTYKNEFVAQTEIWYKESKDILEDVNMLESRKIISIQEAISSNLGLNIDTGSLGLDIISFLTTSPKDLYAETKDAISTTNTLKEFLGEKIVPKKFLGNYVAYYPQPVKRKYQEEVESSEKLYYTRAFFEIFTDGSVVFKNNKAYKGSVKRQSIKEDIFSVELWYQEEESLTIGLYLEDRISKDEVRNFVSATGSGIDPNHNLILLPILLIREEADKQISVEDRIKILTDYFESSIVNFQIRSRRDDVEVAYQDYITKTI
ncbi:hypothetical protein WAF17_14460 [Bernardetia sp. ABR2-2B]|uniref:hypothetical protein n=1 Tax=Bernardetia sp. ABR2-2B TaxID=3127472 RepID=UPI0030CE2DCE